MAVKTGRPRPDEIQSEQATLAAILTLLNVLRRAFGGLVDEQGASGPLWQSGRRAIEEIDAEVRALMRQVQHGIHANPPRGRSQVLSRDVHSIRYTHAHDGRDYEHPFEGEVSMRLHPDGTVSLHHARGEPLWENFP